jgi:hypothetical protein
MARSDFAGCSEVSGKPREFKKSRDRALPELSGTVKIMDGIQDLPDLDAFRSAAESSERPVPKGFDAGDPPEESRTVWSKVLDRLDGRFSWLTSRIEGKIPRDLPAWSVSLAFHGGLLIILGLMGIAAQAELKKEITSQVVDTEIPAFDKTEIQDLDQPDLPAVVNAIGSSAPNFSMIAKEGATASPVATRADGEAPIMLTAPGISKPGQIAMPSAMSIGKNVVIKGSGAEHVNGVEGAVDRIAMELINRLKDGKVLVVWAFDASASLLAEREKLSKNIEQVYTHITQLDKDQVASGDALMTMVVGFGQGRKPMLREPTGDTPSIVSAIREIPLDPSGIENTFQTIGSVAKAWGKFKNSSGEHYQTVVIVVTDEVGDDQDQLEATINVASAAKMPVYILGSPALFGKKEGRMSYIDPKTKKNIQGVVDLGPESVALETIHLPFWYNGDQYETLDAGFGPYALTRLAATTGGIFFVSRIGNARLSFDPNAMREYRPDWVSIDQYNKSLQKDPIRGAVLQAALITQQQLPGQPGLSFPPADDPNFKERMAANQETVARIEYTVNEALVPITHASKLRDHETSRRWQAHYDLIRGRLLAMKIRCAEYQTACARMKKDAPKFKDAKSNAWKLVATEEILSGDKVSKVAKETASLLKRVVEDHPNTPWALLAQRELKDPFGFKWVETYVPPAPPRKEADAAEAKKKKAMTKPEPPANPNQKL